MSAKGPLSGGSLELQPFFVELAKKERSGHEKASNDLMNAVKTMKRR